MTNLIVETIRIVFPESAQLRILDAVSWLENPNVPVIGRKSKELKEKKRARNPVLLYGFCGKGDLKLLANGDLLDHSDVVYLRFPAIIEIIRERVREALDGCKSVGTSLEDRLDRRAAIQAIRGFKHRVDNLFLSLMTNVNLARIDFEQSAGEYPDGLREFKPSLLDLLAEEYDRYKPLLSGLGLKEAVQIPRLLTEARGLVSDMRKGTRDIKGAFIKADACLRKIKRVSDILANVRENE